MKLTAFLAFSLLTFSAPLFGAERASSAPILKPGDLVAICGDSITEQKRYSVYMASYLLACAPQADLRTMELGQGGENTFGFSTRMVTEVLPFKPNVVTTCYGMNDGGYCALKPETEARFREGVQLMIAKFQNAGVRRIVLGSPGAVDTDTFKRMTATPEIYNQTLGELTRIAREIAEKNGVDFVDIHSLMLVAMAKAKAKYGKGYYVAGEDGVHASENGQFIMAYAFLKALGFPGDIGTITYDAKADTAQTVGEHQVISVTKGVIEVESTRYPFCFFGEPSNPNATSGMIEFLPFNEELNRYLLVVKNAPAARMKVTWGTQSREFSADALAKGINLAAEFIENPFCEPFRRLTAALGMQQGVESQSIRPHLRLLLDWETNYPEAFKEKPEVFSWQREAVMKRASAMIEASRKAVTPVRHTLKIEPAS
ncbi:MAG: SGNH/GDSL hydrolase family protein [Verrucomicrobiae bacterium]